MQHSRLFLRRLLLPCDWSLSRRPLRISFTCIRREFLCTRKRVQRAAREESLSHPLPCDALTLGLRRVSHNTGGIPLRQLLAVVSELQGLNILVLGRKHMQQPSRNWNRHDMNQIKQKAHCFFTENISEDDPFLLYAALHSGNHCNFVSRDLMRDHKACLLDSATRRLFFKWQRGHQLVLNNFTPGKRIRFQRTSLYDTVVQSCRKTWHVPYDEDGGERSTYEVPQRWLCLSNNV